MQKRPILKQSLLFLSFYFKEKVIKVDFSLFFLHIPSFIVSFFGANALGVKIISARANRTDFLMTFANAVQGVLLLIISQSILYS